MENNIYKRPPITEAVIQLHFDSQVKNTKYEKLIKKLGKYYPSFHPVKRLEYKINLQESLTTPQTTSKEDLRLSSSDMTEILILKESSMVLSQLAPYKGWDNLISRFERDWKLFKQYIGNKEIAGIGVRYINRIDIPVTEDLVHEDEYLNIYPKQPKILFPLTSYAIQTQSVLNNISATLKLNTAVVPSPLPNHTSILFDQDITKMKGAPQSTEDIIQFLYNIRDEKNSVFESCITDKARELFGNG